MMSENLPEIVGVVDKVIVGSGRAVITVSMPCPIKCNQTSVIIIPVFSYRQEAVTIIEPAMGRNGIYVFRVAPA